MGILGSEGGCYEQSYISEKVEHISETSESLARQKRIFSLKNNYVLFLIDLGSLLELGHDRLEHSSTLVPRKVE